MTHTLIIHGVGNRDEGAFRQTIQPVIEALGATVDVNAHPVYWGGLGPPVTDRYAAVPVDTDTMLLPSVAPAAFVDLPVPAGDLLPPPGVPDAALAANMAHATMRYIDQLAAPAGFASTPQEPVTEPLPVVKEVLDEALAEGKVFALRADLAPLLAAVVVNAPPAHAGFIGEGLVEGVKDALKSVIDVFDREAGKLVNDAATNVLRKAEGALSVPISLTVGDILAYTRHDEAIRGVLDVAYRTAVAAGEDIDIIAHSLGALVAVEWLLGAPCAPPAGGETPAVDRKCRRLVTFGTQVSLFSEAAGLARSDGFYQASPRVNVALPVRQWDNIWHELDPLAFVMGRALELSGTPLHDWRLDAQTLSSMVKFWEFHSRYWTDARFHSWLTAELADGVG